MRLVHFETDQDTGWGVLGDDDVVQVIEGTPFDYPQSQAFVDMRSPAPAVENSALHAAIVTGETVALTDVRLRAPALPATILAVGLNYIDHAEELKMPVPEEPVLFMKPVTALIGPEDEVVYPAVSQQVDYEAELVVVIGLECRDVSPEAAGDYVLGCTCGNDVTARDLQRKDVQWTRAKSFDTFCPLGPWIETELDTSGLRVEARLNGRVVQSSSTAKMIFSVPELVSFCSRVMTLNAGDVIMTGTPPGVGPMQRGDTIEVEVQGIGALRNTVACGGSH